jgi:hypothetical protein
MPDRVAVILPTRGRPDKLVTALKSIQATVFDQYTTDVFVGVDRDDPLTMKLVRDGLELDFHPLAIKWVIAEREDTLGLKYDRLWKASKSHDLFVSFADDALMTTPGWDDVIRTGIKQFPDKMGMLYFGNGMCALPGCIVMSKQLCDELGYFMPTYFPYWWYDTWLDEIGHYIGRILWVPADSQPQKGQRGGTQNMREVNWWAKFFDDMRPERLKAAATIISKIYKDQPYRAHQLHRIMPDLAKAFAERNANLRTPEEAKYFEREMSEAEGPPDARYMRARARAEQMLVERAA